MLSTLIHFQSVPSVCACVFLCVCEQLSEFVQHGVSLLVRDCGGRSALHAAAQNGQTAVVSYILQQGERHSASAEAFKSFSPLDFKVATTTEVRGQIPSGSDSCSAGVWSRFLGICGRSKCCLGCDLVSYMRIGYMSVHHICTISPSTRFKRRRQKQSLFHPTPPFHNGF